MQHYFNQLAPALRERILGSLYGGAVGDALGAPVSSSALARQVSAALHRRRHRSPTTHK